MNNEIQLIHLIASDLIGIYNAELTEQAAYLVAECRARLDEPGANPVFRLHHLLLHVLDLNKAHTGTAYGFTDSFGIIHVVLAAVREEKTRV